MKSWISRASSWNVVEVVRPQPGQAATKGTKVRKPMVCNSSWATLISSVRSPPGFGEAEMDRIVRAPREIDVDRDQVLHRRRLGGEDDARARHPHLLGAPGRE